MELKKPWNDDVVEYHRYLVRECMPLGACHHKAPKAGRWRIKASRPPGVHFDLLGPCSGRLEDVMELGVKLAREAIARGEPEHAERIVRRIQKIPLEYARDKLLRDLQK